MLLQSSLKNPNVSLSSALSYSLPIQPKKTQSFRPRNGDGKRFAGVRCSRSKVHRYGMVDHEHRSPLNWNVIYKRISLMENSEMGSGTVLNQWERQGNQLSKWELCRVVKELRKYNRYVRALEVYEWMSSRGERFRLFSSDAAIQLDLIGKVHGIAAAENFFLGLSETSKDKRTYAAMLNSYVRAKRKEKAESILGRMRAKGYATHSLPFNVMMTLYMNLEDYEKVEATVLEMTEKKIQLDVYSYNIWLSCRGAQGRAEGMEEVCEKMRLDKTINPNWSTFSTMATMYTNMGMFEKAEESLRKVEGRITNRDRVPYHYLLSLYGGIGKKEDVYRVWNVYKVVFPTVSNLGYRAIISSLLRMGDIEGAEKIYEEWLAVKASYDPRITNLFMGYYVKNGNLEKAISFIDHIVEVGGKPNSATWVTLAEGYTAERNAAEALSCWKKAFAAEGSRFWRPKPSNVSDFLGLCDQEANLDSKEVFVGMLKETGLLKDELYASQIELPHEPINDNGITSTGVIYDSDGDDNEESQSAMLLNRL